MRQLAFDLAGAPSFEADQFLSAPCNERALAAIQSWRKWADNVLLLIGPAGSGKTHLAAIFRSLSGAVDLDADALDPSLPVPPAAILDDLDRVARDERALFHLLNRTRTEGGRLLITARQPPHLWALHTPDLLSRLRLAPSRIIDRPDSTLLKAVMVKMFMDRQIMTDESVVSYAVRHCEQSLDGVRQFVDAVDRSALERNGRITRALAAVALAALDVGSNHGPT